MTENRSKGIRFTRVRLVVDTSTKRVIYRTADFHKPWDIGITPDAAIQSRIDDADGVDFAITNSGGLRADLTCPTTDNASDFCPAYTPPPYPITRGQVLTVLPFGNVVTTLDVNGAEFKTMLENGISRMPAVDGRFPQVSGLCFSYDISAPVGWGDGCGAAGCGRVLHRCGRRPDGCLDVLDRQNDFMSGGGDGYPVFTARVTTRDIMDQVLADSITAQGTVSPAIQGRVTCTTSGVTPCPVVVP